MTVGELIEELQKYDLDLDVEFTASDFARLLSDVCLEEYAMGYRTVVLS